DDTYSDDMGDMAGRISTDTVAVTTTSTHHSVCDYILDNDDDDIQNNLKFVDNPSQLFSNRLWSSRRKPDADVLLRDILAQLETYCTAISLNEQEYHFVVRIQGFPADLPAKSLFLKTINFNGRFECTWCRSSDELNTVWLLTDDCYLFFNHFEQ
ncbi:unnamed protein product, partial [Rotaria socialis]